MLALVVGCLIEEAQTCAILLRSIHDNIRFMCYNVERAGTKTSFSGALINLDYLKVVDRVDHHYLEVVLKAAAFGPVFRAGLLQRIAVPAR